MSPHLAILAGCLVALVSFGVRSSAGLFTEPLGAVHGWGREVYALAIALQNLVWGLAQPFAGGLADRYGPARVLAGGGALVAVALAVAAALAHLPIRERRAAAAAPAA